MGCKASLTATSRWRLVCRIALPLIALLLIAGCGSKTPGGPQADPPSNARGEARDDGLPDADAARHLQAAMERGDWQGAQRLAAQAMLAQPDDPDVLTNVAIVTGRAGNQSEAAQLLARAVRASDYDIAGQRVDHAVGGLIQVGRLYDAIELIEEVLAEHPEAHRYRRMLVGFLGEAQLTADLPKHMSLLVRQRQFDLMLLTATTETSFRRFDSKTIDKLLARNPSDWRPKLGRAYQRLEARDAAGAEQLLNQIVQRHPGFAPAHALLGRALVAQGKSAAFADWFRRLPDGVSEFPGYWLVLGESSLLRDETAAAARAFAEATRRNPNDGFAWTRLADAIATLRFGEDKNELPDTVDLDLVADSIAKRREDLLQLRERFSQFRDGRQDSQTRAVQIAETLFDLGRYWESEAWLAIASTLPSEPTDRVSMLRDEVLEALRVDPVWQSQRGHPELSFDLSVLPAASLPESSATTASHQRGQSGISEIRMSNEANRWGLNFYGSVGPQVKGPRVPIYQTLGCGGGTIDFDNDGKHDLALAAAGGSAGKQDSEPGQLFRNVGGSFEPCGEAAGFADRGFSHGVAVGDYNDDGFADVLVLNLGHNRLLRNNGDGTFSDASSDLGDEGAFGTNESRGEWSTSGAIADVNSDGFGDIVVVNYCDSNEPIDEPCRDDKGHEINCYPLRFRAAADRFLEGTETGRFSDATRQWMETSSIGRGLGIVVGRLDGRNQGVYIANDASINHLYRWSNTDASLPMTDSGITSGLAVDAQSLDQGSMGIACSDFDQDGDLDLYVTGFANEYNIFYQQQSVGLWTDRSGIGNLIAPTLQTVGFGTQAVDLDQDGIDELLVTNGHIGDYGKQSPPYAQPMQIFRQSTSMRWESIPTRPWNGYFSKDHVGRAMFTLDANQDGNTDVVVTHATEPVALLLSRCESNNHRVAFRLVDTRQARDGVGAVIRFELDGSEEDGSRALFRLAGSGYLCSNQPELVAGTGQAKKIRNVRVTWPDGSEQTLGNLQSDKKYLIVRGQRPFALDHYRRD